MASAAEARAKQEAAARQKAEQDARRGGGQGYKQARPPLLNPNKPVYLQP